MNISILGCGNWGSVFGILQCNSGHAVKIWEYDRARVERIKETRNNEPFLVGHTIPPAITVHSDIERSIENADVIVFALPSQVLHAVVSKLAQYQVKTKYFLSLTKGIDTKLLKRPSEIINELSPHSRTYVLSGPCIANEIIRGEPTAVVLVGPDPQGTKFLQHQLASRNFRIYQSTDIVGVELGAAIKNVIALGSGICTGLGYGKNAKGALITRGIIEMQRLGKKMGAEVKTFWGLSGLGDLVTTSFSEESRNHIFGKHIGQGKTVDKVTEAMVMVAEGVPTSQAIKKLAKNHKVEMPICNIVYQILFCDKSPDQAIRDLMTRPLKYE